MWQVRGVLGWITCQHYAAMGLAWISLLGIPSAQAQVADPTPKPAPPRRLLTVQEGRSIVTAAWEQSSSTPETQDCSHLVHQIYLGAGFEYPYASSIEMYAGNERFARVKFPHTGDLIVWPGHMGIVVDPLKHSFYSLVSTGLDEQDYETPYWRSRGRPRFYRYRVENPVALSATKTSTSSQLSTNNMQRPATVAVAERSPEAAEPDRTALIYGPPAPSELVNGTSRFEIPPSISVASGSKPPTRVDVAKGVSTLNDMAGKVLRQDDLFTNPLSVVIVDRFSVERVEIKRDRSWAHLRVDSKVCIGCGSSRPKRSRQKVRWELRRTPSGWELVTPPDRTYVSHDVDVKNLAAQLALLAESDRDAAHLESVLRQESQLANLLSALIENN